MKGAFLHIKRDQVLINQNQERTKENKEAQRQPKERLHLSSPDQSFGARCHMIRFSFGMEKLATMKPRGHLPTHSEV